MNYVKKHKKIIVLLMTFISLLFVKGIYNSSFKIYESVIFFIIIYSFFYKNDFDNKILKDDIIILSIWFSILLSFGDILYKNMWELTGSSIIDFFQFSNLYKTIGLFNLIYVILNTIIPKVYNLNITRPRKEYRQIVFLGGIIIIFLCWIPYFLTYYPGLITNDTLDELKDVFNNFVNIDNHHPIFHKFMLYCTFNIGKFLFGSLRGGLVFTTITQMILMASIFSYTLYFLYKRNVKKEVLLVVLAFYALLPVHAIYSITIWKDVIFGGLILLLTLETIKIVELYNSKKLTFKRIIPFIIIITLTLFTRNNAIYMFIVFSIIVLIILKGKRLLLGTVFVSITVLYFVISGPVYNALNIKKTSSADYLAIPLQMVARMAYKDVEFTDKEELLIGALIPVERLKAIYYPYCVDRIKFDELYNEDFFNNHKLLYLKLFTTVSFKHLDTAIEGFGSSTIGYWYPNFRYWYSANGSIGRNNDFNEYFIDSKLSHKVSSNIDKLNSLNTSLINIQRSIGLFMGIYIVFNAISYRKKGYVGIVPYIFIFALWLTLMIASPVSGEYRYIYGLFTTIPVLVIYPYLKK